jgi:hypothetical protein
MMRAPGKAQPTDADNASSYTFGAYLHSGLSHFFPVGSKALKLRGLAYWALSFSI